MIIKLVIALVFIMLWLFSTMLKVNDRHDTRAAFIWKSIFFWVAIFIAYALGQMSVTITL